MIKQKIPLVSVIITNYNYAKFIGEAIESVLSQTYNNIEIIIIDDGSTDNSARVIEQYSKEHKNIQLVTQVNKGVVSARNTGIEKSLGEFFVFIDADDTIPETFIAEMLSTMNTEKVDVVFCDLKLSDKLKGTLIIEPQSIKGLKNFNPTPICQLVRRAVLGDIRFDERLSGLAHEDNDFFFHLFLKGAKFAKSKTYYNYRIHGNGRSPDISTEKHYKARLYILNKYKNEHELLNNGLVDLLVDKDKQIKKWHTVADERLDLIEEKDRYIKTIEYEINKQNQKYSDLLNSSRYKIGKTVTLPIYGLKKIIKKAKE